MKTMIRVLLLGLFAGLLASAPVYAQGKGNDKQQEQGNAKGDKGNDRAPKASADRGPGKAQAKQNDDKGRGNDKARDNARGKGNDRGNDKADRDGDRGNSGVARGNAGRKGGYSRAVAVRDLNPKLRGYAASNRAPQRIAAGAVARGLARGLNDDDIVIRDNAGGIRLLNRRGDVLVDLDDQRARNLGNWRVDPWDDDAREGAPAFCRSGEGHPVWGREWCMDKGFGLGDYRDLRWGRTTDVGDIIFRSTDRGSLARDVLVGVLGDVVLNRLGLHAVTLGYSDPLTGVWLGEPTGPQVLRVSSGAVPIAEFYDGNRDNRADVLVVALRPW